MSIHKTIQILGLGAVSLLSSCATRGVVVVESAPPPPVVVSDYTCEVVPICPPIPHEVRPAPPTRAHVWCDGFYRWTGRAYVFVPGHWDRAPFAHARFVGGRWVARGRGYAWVEGHFERA